ncbi:MAG: SH3 domain-containing protein, partial [Bacillota bacterium]|nr:SH3 domain-containing protein [Bacillota bacterium]
NCGKRLKDNEVCPACGHLNGADRINPLEDTIVVEIDSNKNKPIVKQKTSEEKADIEVAIPSGKKATSVEKPRKPKRNKNYDHVGKSGSTGENVGLKAAIIVILALIITIGAGTVIFVNSELRHDTTVRHNKLVEMGATQGVSKLQTDTDLGKYLYVSGAVDYLPLLSEPSSEEGEELEQMTNGTLVTLEEKTDRIYWKVTDYVTGVQGYASVAHLTADPDKVIQIHNDSLESLGEMGQEGEKIEDIYYVLNAGIGVGVFSDMTLADETAIDVLVDGNTVGLVSRTTDDIWRIYDYKSSQYGYMESKYLTDNPDALKMAKEATGVTDNLDEDEDEKEQDENKYYVSWSDSALGVRSSPTEDSDQIGRLVYGDEVEVLDRTNDDFWRVYIPDQDIEGYVKAACISPVGEDE